MAILVTMAIVFCITVVIIIFLYLRNSRKVVRQDDGAPMNEPGPRNHALREEGDQENSQAGL